MKKKGQIRIKNFKKKVKKPFNKIGDIVVEDAISGYMKKKGKTKKLVWKNW